MALYNIEVRDMHTRELYDQAQYQTLEDALEIVEEFEREYQDDPSISVEMIRQ